MGQHVVTSIDSPVGDHWDGRGRMIARPLWAAARRLRQSTPALCYTTVELIVAEAEAQPQTRKPRANRSPEEMVYVRVAFGEEGLRAKMKALGAIWRPQHKLWELPWGVVRGLGIDDRVVGSER